MGTLLLFKEIYQEAFRNTSPKFVALLLKTFSWFCFFCLGMLFYAFTYRLVTGYPFY